MGMNPISINSWEEDLNRRWKQRVADLGRKPRTSLIGIGYELGGDDGAGVAVILTLEKEQPSWDWVQLVNADAAPENITGAVRRFKPEWILLVDAADTGADPGSITWLDPQSTTGFSASTHTLPLQVLAHYLETELQCPVDLIGIQPQSLGFSEPLTAPVHQAVTDVADVLSRLFTAA